LHTASSCQIHSRGDTYFGGMLKFGTYVPEIK
jgi:hypothetical protein